MSASDTRTHGRSGPVAGAGSGRHLLIVCHAGVMRAVAGHVLAAPAGRWYRLRIDYAGVMRVRHGPHAPVLECLNASRVPGAAP